MAVDYSFLVGIIFLFVFFFFFAVSVPQQEAGCLVEHEWEMMATHRELHFHTNQLNLQQGRKVDSVDFEQQLFGKWQV